MKSKPFFFEIPLEVRTYDIDFAGIVSNIVYVRWMEDLRLELLEPHYPIRRQLQEGFAPVLARTWIKYKRPIDIHSKVSGRMWVKELDSCKWVVAAEVVTNGKVAAVSEQTGLFVTLSDGRPMKIPGELLKKYAALVADKKV